MTACVNKHTKRVAAVVTASLVGALSLGASPVAAMATGVDVLADVEGTTQSWQGVMFDWNVDVDEYGEYTVQKGDAFTLDSATYADGTTPVNMADVTVLYTNSTDKTLDTADKVWTSTSALPAGEYKAFVFNGKVEMTANWKEGTVLWAQDVPAFNALPHQVVDFRVASKSLSGTYAYQGNDVNDTTFQYTGWAFNDGNEENTGDLHFADSAGNKLTVEVGSSSSIDTDAIVKSIYKVGNTSTDYKSGLLVDAGKYIVTLEGVNEYSGSSASVEFTIRQIDLENDDIYIAPYALVDDGPVTSAADLSIFVNGEKVDSSKFKLPTMSAVDENGTPINGFAANEQAQALVSVLPATPGDNNFADPSYTGKTVTVYFVNHRVDDFYYDGMTIQADGSTEFRFETAKGDVFDPQYITAVYGGEDVARSVTVYKDGEVVTDYSEPGTYTVKVAVKVDPQKLDIAGDVTFKAIVVSKRYSEQPKVYASVDGKDAKNPVEYDAKAVTPKVVAKAGSTVLTEGEDYTVAYKDAEGNAVEEIVEPGTYTATVDFGNAYYWKNGKAEQVKNVEFEVKVTKAEVETAKADQDLYPYVEDQAVAPTFTAYTKANFKGLSVAIDPATDGATYYEVVCGKDGKPVAPSATAIVDADNIDVDGDKLPDYVIDSSAPMTGSELTETGWYLAEITVPNDDAHFTGSVWTAPFQVSTYSVYADVAADAWYAQDVFAAREQGYMTGIAGTNLFMPEADITRGEIAQVFYNMSGADWSEDYGTSGYVPTKFDDVEGWAWYAEPIAWASNAGVVTGYDDTTFGPADHATREQVATMLYRYAKTQGKDVSVKDADAALAAYKDADQVSDWAKEAMAWAVENGIFGVDTDELWANQNIQRAAVASIAVRFQPEALPEA